MKKKSMLLIFSCAVVLSLLSLPAFAETVNCTSIASLPYTITSAGVYCLKGNKSISNSSSHAITINADNVTLDLNGFELKAINPGPGTKAIVANGKSNITVKNGIINGFLGTSESIYVVDDVHVGAKNAAVENLRVVNSSCIRVDVSNSVIRNNQYSGDSAYDGIVVHGAAIAKTLIVDNDIYNARTGIYVSSTANTVVEDNRVSGPALGNGSVGIYVSPNSVNTLVVNNRIGTVDTGISFQGTGKYRDNLTSGCSVAYDIGAGAVDAGNNN